jgi:hypothetical protein
MLVEGIAVVTMSAFAEFLQVSCDNLSQGTCIGNVRQFSLLAVQSDYLQLLLVCLMGNLSDEVAVTEC